MAKWGYEILTSTSGKYYLKSTKEVPFEEVNFDMKDPNKGQEYIGPFGTRRAAEKFIRKLHMEEK